MERSALLGSESFGLEVLLVGFYRGGFGVIGLIVMSRFVTGSEFG